MQVRQWWRARAVDDDTRLDAQELLLHCLDVRRSSFYMMQNQQLSCEQLNWLDNQWLERVKGRPLPYILGRAWFWGMSLRVSADVLIPRPDTEVLVRALLDLDLPSQAKVADLGTGSAAIALAAALERPQWCLIGVDQSELALQIARQNVHDLAPGRVHLVRGSWFGPLRPQSLDVVVSNPPYLAPDDPHLVDLGDEPRSALVAEDQGFADLFELIQTAPAYLRPRGWLLLEHGWQQGEAVNQAFRNAGWQCVRTLTDLAARDRVSLGQWHG